MRCWVRRALKARKEQIEAAELINREMRALIVCGFVCVHVPVNVELPGQVLAVGISFPYLLEGKGREGMEGKWQERQGFWYLSQGKETDSV